MKATLRILAVAGAATFACAAQAQSDSVQASGSVPTVLLPYGVSTVARAHTPLSGPIVTMPVREGVQAAAAPYNVPAAASATVTTQTAPAPAPQ